MDGDPPRARLGARLQPGRLTVEGEAKLIPALKRVQRKHKERPDLQALLNLRTIRAPESRGRYRNDVTDPNRITAHFPFASLSGRIEALEGGGGFMRVSLELQDARQELTAGTEAELEMHDGARFRVTVVEPLGAEERRGEYRMKLLGRGG